MLLYFGSMPSRRPAADHAMQRPDILYGNGILKTTCKMGIRREGHGSQHNWNFPFWWRHLTNYFVHCGPGISKVPHSNFYIKLIYVRTWLPSEHRGYVNNFPAGLYLCTSECFP
jgi:hypothetical protein